MRKRDKTILKVQILNALHLPCKECGEEFPVLKMFFDDRNPEPHQFWCARCVKFPNVLKNLGYHANA